MIRKGKLERWAEQWRKSAEGFKNGAEQSLKEGTTEKKKVVQGRLELGKNWLALIEDLERTFDLKPKK